MIFVVVFAGALAVGWVVDTIDESRGFARWDNSADLAGHGIGFLLWGLLDFVVDGHFTTVQQLAAAVQAAGLGEVDKRKIQITTPIKAVGDHEATVRLHDEVSATITLQVVAAK